MPTLNKASPAPKRLLPEGYYLDNFETVLRTAGERYEDLLLPAEQAFLENFATLARGSRRLYVRLISRRGPVFRCDRMEYPEVGPIDEALAELETAGFADRAEDAGVGELLPLLLRAELAEMAAELVPADAPSQARKHELIAALVEQAPEARLRHAVGERVEVVRLLRAEQVLVFRLLFFGNLSQDWTSSCSATSGWCATRPTSCAATCGCFRAAGRSTTTCGFGRRSSRSSATSRAGDGEQAVAAGAGSCSSMPSPRRGANGT